MTDAGVAFELTVVEGAYHAFDLFRPDAPGSLRFLDAMIAPMGARLGLRGWQVA